MSCTGGADARCGSWLPCTPPKARFRLREPAARFTVSGLFLDQTPEGCDGFLQSARLHQGDSQVAEKRGGPGLERHGLAKPLRRLAVLSLTLEDQPDRVAGVGRLRLDAQHAPE